MGKLGPPADAGNPEAGETLRYAIGPFPQVVFHLEHEVVQSVVVHLASPGSREDVARELSLGAFRPVVVHDDQDRPLGEVYPERGLMFAYQAATGLEGEVRISHVVLETISAEPFLMRPAREGGALRSSPGRSADCPATRTRRAGLTCRWRGLSSDWVAPEPRWRPRSRRSNWTGIASSIG